MPTAKAAPKSKPKSKVAAAGPSKRPASAARKPPRKAAVRRGEPVDLVRRHPTCFQATRTPVIIRLKPLNYLTLEGRGAPESREFQDAIGALFGVAYALKFAQQAAGHDFKVPPFEALWWSGYDLARLEDPRALWRVPRQTWCWKVLLLLPDFVTSEDVRSARQALSDKRGGEPLPLCVRLERIDEGKCVQMLHVGPYATEPESVRKMQALIKEQGLTPCGLHHEIYLGDPHRTPPARLRTILRQSVR